ncbi:MAG: FAD-dependent oxidoreductase [Planctomycetaceae bacterium]|jgi:protoporphyrinogen oxidase|nr:FAD-dependent oxidoreductase [Planctomycetaceae bacterium]
MNNVIILGSGIAGLAASYGLGHNATIYEARETVGGLCDSFNIQGFCFDNAVHFSFAKEERAIPFFQKTEHFSHPPDAWNFAQEFWIRHPVQNNLHALPIEERIKAISGFFKRPPLQENVETFQQWLHIQFGDYIATEFPERYTRKYWREEASVLGTDWVGYRMYRPSEEEVLYGAFSSETKNVYYADAMLYPKTGGFIRFLDPLRKNARIVFSKCSELIDVKKKMIFFTDGTSVTYDHLISTLPLTKIVQQIKDIPTEMKDTAKQLAATQVVIVSMGFKRPDIMKYLWWYIYDEDILAARIYSSGLKSPNNVPKNCGAIQMECYLHPGKEKFLSEDYYINNALYALEKMKLASKNEPLFVDVRLLPYGNVIHYPDTRSRADKIQKYLKSIDILSAGRFGEWKYYWTDQALVSGLNAAEELKLM